MVDWLARLPEKGAGLSVTHVQESPPSVPGTAPAGKASSTHGTLLLAPVGGGRLLTTVKVLAGAVILIALARASAEG